MKDAFSLFGRFNPGQTLPRRAKRIFSGQWDQPSFEMSMARKDLRLMVEEAARGVQTLAMVPALAALLDQGIAAGWVHQAAVQVAVSAGFASCPSRTERASLFKERSMKKFLVLYMIPPSVMDEWKKTPSDDRKVAEDKMSREIQAWTGGRGKMFSDRGAGLGKAKRITSSGVSDERNALAMYAIVQGESPDAVAQAFTSHPHLQIPQSSIEVMELFALPDQAKQ